jgi:LDH2 family malate/lactate/ureidoglycolate dehydrogenase
VVLDIANTGVARGKVYAARERGERLPDGWAIDASGLPTNDPQAALDGLILPMSGHKGYAISFMMDVLSAYLPEAPSELTSSDPTSQTSAADAGTW